MSMPKDGAFDRKTGGGHARASLLHQAFARCRGGLAVVAVVSGFINLLYLTSPFFMLQVYDRIIPSGSIGSLIALCLLAGMLFVCQGAFEIVRSRMLSRLAALFEVTLDRVLFRRSLLLCGKQAIVSTNDDLDMVRGFLSGPGPSALFDLPWLPVYLAICFLLHPVIGFVALAGVLILMVLTALAHFSLRQSQRDLAVLTANRRGFSDSVRLNFGALRAMGMTGDVAERWAAHNAVFRLFGTRHADVANTYATMTKVLRVALQSGVLAVGAVLVIRGDASGGIILASSILTSRALAPVEAAIVHWRAFAAARHSWLRLEVIVAAETDRETLSELPLPSCNITVEAMAGGPPEAKKTIITEIGFSLEAGTVLGVIGHSGSGKTVLARLLMGIWPVSSGTLRFDGATMDQWDVDRLGSHMGYLPQEVALFGGTIAQNIARFRKNIPSAEVIAAAKTAGVHDLILQLPDGYDTLIDPQFPILSAGQRQRIALARALYGEPFLVVLDEPNAHLDAEGEEALFRAIDSIRMRGGIAVVITHRPGILAQADKILVLKEGKMAAFGPREAIMGQVLRKPAARSAKILKVVGATGKLEVTR
ncbi:type I secretion system permease/ATPase [Rhizobium sp. NFACC06-2]|uniref:type I secretion system permease/ATPase n=1 Tax=Rhizobium sp. NFACC06-2 TaxID=1566264 RepID=UPI00257048CA|nr:type I secretion system permease/ATPase [Rhizobium sp. NFACC06-2]